MGSNQNCEICGLSIEASGFPTFLGLVFYLFGDSEQVAFNTNAIIGSISIFLIFLLIFLMYHNSTLALIGAFIFSFIPVHLKYSGTSSHGIFSVFFVILCMILLEIYIKTKKYSLFLLFLTTLLYSIHIRHENLLLIPIFFLYFLIKDGKIIKQKFHLRYLIPFFISVLIIILFSWFTYYTVKTYSIPGLDSSLLEKISYLRTYSIPNLIFFINYNFNSIIFSFLCFLGYIKLYLKNRKQLYYLGSFFLLFFLMYSSHYLGELTTFADTVRYSLILYIPLIIISISGIKFILDKIHINKRVLIVLITLTFLISLFPTLNFIFFKSPLDIEHEFILSMEDKLPSDIYIISYNTAVIISTIHKKSITPSNFIGHMDSQILGNNVILFKDYWWYKYIEKSNEIEDKLKEHYSFKLIEKKGFYGFYNLTLK